MAIECRIGGGTYTLPNMLECLRACGELSPADADPLSEVAFVGPAEDGTSVYACPYLVEQFSLFEYALEHANDNEDYWGIVVEVAQEVFLRAFVTSQRPQDVAEWQSIVRQLETAELTSDSVDLLRDLATADINEEDRTLLYNLAVSDDVGYAALLPRLRQRIVSGWEMNTYSRVLEDYEQRTDALFSSFLVRIMGQDYISVVTAALLDSSGLNSYSQQQDRDLFFMEEEAIREYLWLRRESDVDEADKSLFLRSALDFSFRYHAYPLASQERILLGRLLSQFQYFADKFGFTQELLMGIFRGSDLSPDQTVPVEENITLTELDEDLLEEDIIVACRPEEMPWELTQTLDRIGYYEFIVENVESIHFYGRNNDALAFAQETCRYDQGGEAFWLGRVVYVSFFETSGWRRPIYELAAALVHEAAHIFNPQRGLWGERYAFYMERKFLKDLLISGLQQGYILSDSVLAREIARLIIETGDNILAADRALAENPQATGYPLDLAIDDTDRIDPAALVALGFDQRSANILQSLILRLLQQGTTFEASYIREMIEIFSYRMLEPRLSLVDLQGERYVLSQEEILLFESFIYSLHFVTNTLWSLADAESVNMPGLAFLKDEAVLGGMIWVDERGDTLFIEALNAGRSPAGIRMQESFSLPGSALRRAIYSFNRAYEADLYLARF
jgi:hypothetical protein